MKKLLEITKGHRLLYVIAIIAVGVATFISMLEPLVIKITIDSIIGNKPINENAVIVNFIEGLGGRSVLSKNLWICAICLVALTSFRGIFLFFQGKLSAEATENMAKSIRVKLYNHIQHLPYKYHVNAESGDLIQRCTSDVDTIRRFFANQMVQIGKCIFMVVFAFIMMLSMDVKMTFISIITVPVVFVFSFVFFKKVKHTFQIADEQEGVLTSTIEQNLTGVRVVKAFGREQFEIEKFEEQNKKFRELNYDVAKLMSTFWASSDFLCTFQIGLSLVCGIYFTVHGEITLGMLVAFNTYVGRLIWPMRQLGRILSDMGKMTVSLKRINDVLSEEEEKEFGKSLKPEVKGEISFENVNFEYEENMPVLEDVSFNVKQGETIAIVGPTGSGKSSLIHLLLRLYDYKSGSIKIDGVELKDISREWIRSKVGIVLQEPFLYSRTIKDNIKMAKLDADDEEIVRATSMAAVHDVIKTFEKGYDTIVGEKGVTLSGGQRQRVAIARTLIKKLPILIFDDSLSAVDAETDKIIRKQLSRRSKGVTTFIISHRISTVMDADKIVVLNHGKVEAIGKHQELIRKEGVYKRIWQIQNSKENDKEEKLA